jgi:hypothetical protein
MFDDDKNAGHRMQVSPILILKLLNHRVTFAKLLKFSPKFSLKWNPSSFNAATVSQPMINPAVETSDSDIPVSCTVYVWSIHH